MIATKTREGQKPSRSPAKPPMQKRNKLTPPIRPKPPQLPAQLGYTHNITKYMCGDGGEDGRGAEEEVGCVEAEEGCIC